MANSKAPGFVSGNFDASYKDKMNCTPSSGSAWGVNITIALSQSVVVDGSTVQGISAGICPDDIVEYHEGVDFKSLTALAGSIEAALEALEDTDSVYVQNTVGQITRTKSLGIKMEHQSNYLAALRNIVQSDAILGYDGKLIQAYSNGGFHIIVEIVNKVDNYSLTEVTLNAKTGNWPDMYADLEDDSEFTQEFSIEYSPLYELKGSVSNALGLPEGTTLSIDSTETLDTEGNLTLTATPLSSITSLTKKVYVQVFANTEEKVTTTPDAVSVIEAGEEVSIQLPGNPLTATVQYFYTPEQAQVLIPGHTVEVSVPDLVKAVGSIASVTYTDATSAEITYDYTANDELIGSASITLFDGTNTVTIDTLTEGTGNTVAATGLVEATSYQVDLLQGTRVLDTKTYNHEAAAFAPTVPQKNTKASKKGK